jgi:hypothetical protein
VVVRDTALIEEWLTRYRLAWSTDDRSLLAGLFTDDVRYYTAPHREPLRGLDEVAMYWAGEREWEVPWHFDCEVIAEGDGGLWVVRAVTRYPEGTRDADGPEVFRNLWLVTLADDGRAGEFVEFFMLED